MNRSLTNGKNVVFCQQWEESERDWGVRPDGYSLHLTIQDLEEFKSVYWSRMSEYIPDEYSRPCGQHYECFIDDNIYRDLIESKSKHGLRFFERSPKPIEI